jgi:type III secretory pathway component EscV
MAGSSQDAERAGLRLGGATGVALFVVAIVAMMIVPLPRPMLDILLVVNFAFSVALLLAALSSRATLEMSTFPTLLVLATLFRLALNVSTVRLILLSADAGRVVHAFGAFVVRGDYVVGFAIFLILTIVQYLVIARGAERVAEVAARFSLDALPGAQLAIDAELRTGQIDAVEARRRRAASMGEAQLYGALDGAMRFVKGDAIAGIIILGVSLVGGLIVGVLERGVSIGDAARTYTLLTIGDGLVSQLPALLVSTAAGLVVTRAAARPGAALLGELGRPATLYITAALLAALALVPGLPLVPFLAVGAAGAGVAFLIGRRRGAAVAPTVPTPPAAIEIVVHPSLGLSDGLTAQLEARAAELAARFGVLVPSVAMRQDPSLPPRSYRLSFRGIARAQGALAERRLLAAVGPAALPDGIAGEPATHPTTGALASWVDENARPALAAAGVATLDGAAFVAATFAAELERSAAELIGLDETQKLLEAAQAANPVLVREVVPRRLELPVFAELLRRLVAERVSIADLREILEAIARTRDVDNKTDAATLVERVRGQLSARLTAACARDNRVEALVLEPDAEDALRGALRPGGDGLVLALEPDLADALLASVGRERAANPRGVLVVPADLRRHVRRLVAADYPSLTVLSWHELAGDVEVERVGSVGI